ncbi:MAG: peptidase U32 family protein [Bacillota bacterium]
MKKPELLAPAGDLEKLKIALLYGADAVFIGGKAFSLRARASNFDLDTIKEAVDFAHERGKKIYVTVNMYPHEEDLEGLETYLKDLEEIGVDAVIVASHAVVRTVKNTTNLEIHISTQQSITNHAAANFLGKKGAERIVLARELSLDEIEILKPRTDLELEVFIHGGMCVSYSGKCTLSNTMTDRDANRGGCAHSCRWHYDLFKEDLKLNQAEPFAMASKDLQTVQHISKLIDIGVDSLKIEGRMKSIHYVATVVNTYRRLIDDITEEIEPDIPRYLLNIKKAENRLTSDGFMRGMTTIEQQLYNLRSEQPTQAFVGIVLDYDKLNHRALIEQRNYFTEGDFLERFSPTQELLTFTANNMSTDEGEKIAIARHPKERIWVDAPFEMAPYDILRKVSI